MIYSDAMKTPKKVIQIEDLPELMFFCIYQLTIYLYEKNEMKSPVSTWIGG